MATAAEHGNALGGAGPRSAGALAFAPDGTLFVGDSREGAIWAYPVSRRFEDVCGNRLGEALDHLLAARQRSRSGALSFRPCLDGALRGAERGHHPIVVSYHCDRLANRRALIVGAGPGISASLAHRLAPRWAQTHLERFAAKLIPAFRSNRNDPECS